MEIHFHILILVCTAITLFGCLILITKMRTNKLEKNSKGNIVYIIRNKSYFDLYVRLVLLVYNPIFIFSILFISSLLIRISLTLNFNIIYDLLHEILPIHHMMEGNPDTGSGQGSDNNPNSPTSSNSDDASDKSSTNNEEVSRESIDYYEREAQINVLEGEIEVHKSEKEVVDSNIERLRDNPNRRREYQSQCLSSMILDCLIFEREDEIRGLRALPTEAARQNE